MALFDAIIAETGERFDLTGDQSKALLAALLDLMSDSKNGSFRGFSSRFSNANLSDAFSSWTATGENATISKEQIETALGAETIAAVADRAGLDYATTVAAMTFLLPQTIDRLTANGAPPDEQKLRSVVGELSGESNEPADGAASPTNAASTNAFDRIGNATEDIAGKEYNMLSDNQIGTFAPRGDRLSAESSAISRNIKNENSDDVFNDDSPLKWLAPLIIVILLVALGFWFCGGNVAAR